MHGVGVEEGLLSRVKPALAFESFPIVVIGLPATARRLLAVQERIGLTIDEYRAGTAASLAAAVLRSGEIELVAEDSRETPFRVHIDALEQNR